MKTLKINRTIFINSIFLLLLIFACNPYAGLQEETTTRGKIKIGVDESMYLLSEAELYTFQSIYTNAHITPIYKPEQDLMDELLNDSLRKKDSLRIFITTRQLTKNEESYLNGKYIYPVTSPIAYDAVAFIVNLKSKDTLLKYNVIENIFKGKIKYWNEIDKNNNSGKINVVFDNLKSSNVRYIKETFKIDSFPKNCFVATKNEEVINYVEKNSNAIGVIGVNWISDTQDSLTRNFLNRIKVVAVTPTYDPEGEDYYKPYQAYVANKSYPFTRVVYIINRESFTGLGSGFTAFVSGDQGQRIVRRMGMVPATMPVRIVKLTKK